MTTDLIPPIAHPESVYVAPKIFRRLCSMAYEAVLLFGVYFISAYLFLALTQQKHLSQSPFLPIFQIYLLVVFGIYFIYCWTHSGQTLAMKSWGLKLVDQEGCVLRPRQALLRYVLAYAWYLPTLVLGFALGYQGMSHALILFFSLFPSIFLWALTALLHPSRQFLHDRLAKTQIINVP